MHTDRRHKVLFYIIKNMCYGFASVFIFIFFSQKISQKKFLSHGKGSLQHQPNGKPKRQGAATSMAEVIIIFTAGFNLF
jgi:hypothetical protein